MNKIVLMMFVALLCSFPVQAAGPGAVRKTVESSMLLTGTLLVGPDGQVSEYAIDQAGEVAKGVLDFVGRNVREWKFEPTLHNDKPASVRNKMSIRVVAKEQEDGGFTIRLGGVSFLPFKVEEGTQVASTIMAPPRYPESAARAGATGTVYLVVKVGRDGGVEEVVAEQVNLEFVANENIMERSRKIFADASIQAAKQWKFAPPVKGEDMDDAYWTVRVPVDYILHADKQHRYGEWKSYVPGPRRQVPWDELHDLPSFSPDTMVAGNGIYQASKGLRLLTPLQEG
ncbi:MAG: energy transducer TonB [Lysobacteraceae bacterium]|nr:MAG: energy transducer TonB [Xanthomonadaceae bacterium]